MKNIRKAALAAAAMICACHTPARADDYKVYSPVAVKGEFALESNTNYTADDSSAKSNYLSEVAGFEYGIADWWQTELSVEMEKGNHDSLIASNLKWENIFVPFRQGEKFVDVGLYLEYEKALHSGDPDNVEGKLLLEKSIGDYTNTANLIISHEVGRNSASDTNTGFNWRTKYRYSREFQPGFEYYADTGPISQHVSFADQQQLIGPVAEGKLGSVNYDAGLLFGVSHASPDATLKLNFEYEF